MTTRSATDAVASSSPSAPIDPELFKGVPVNLDVRLGEARLTVAEILALRAGSVVTLDAPLDTLVELRFNGTVIARGEIVAVDDRFAIRLVEVGTATGEGR